MDGRAALPVTLPVENPTRSFWQDPPNAIARLRSATELPATADVVIVGSGITGAAVAWRLLSGDRKRDVVMLEARDACSGATGRNGGHTKAASYRSFLDHAREHGTDVAVQIARLELANIKATHAFAKEHAIPCDSNLCPTVDVIYDAGQLQKAHNAITAMREAMPDDPVSEYALHSAEEVHKRFYCAEGTDQGVCGAIEYLAGSLSAYQFGTGVLKLCLEKGLKLQTHTPALAVTKKTTTTDQADAYQWAVETAEGTIRAKQVVLATNGYTAFLHRKFQRVIVPLRGHVTAQRPGTGMPTLGLPTTYSFIYQDGYDYMISRPPGSKFEGGIIIGGGLTKAPNDGLEEYGITDDASLNRVIEAYLTATLPRYFGASWGEDHACGRLHSQWTGIMGYSPDGFPFVGEMPGEQGMWVCAGFQGHGMVYCWMCARALVEMMEGGDGEQLKSWFPDVLRVKEERFGKRFEGRLHTTAGGAS